MAEPIDVPSRRPPRSRALLIAAIVVAVGLLLLTITLIATGEGEEGFEITGVNETNTLVGGMAQEGNALGSPEAPVTISLFNDLQCPECVDYQAEVVPPLIEDLVRPGEARLEFRHFSIGRGNATTLSAVAATAAGEQQRQWQFIQLEFENLDEVTSDVDLDFLRTIAGSAGLDVAIWDEAMDSGEFVAAVEADAMLAAELKLTAEPAVVVDGIGGTRVLEEEPSVAEIEAAVEAVRE